MPFKNVSVLEGREMLIKLTGDSTEAQYEEGGK